MRHIFSLLIFCLFTVYDGDAQKIDIILQHDNKYQYRVNGRNVSTYGMLYYMRDNKEALIKVEQARRDLRLARFLAVNGLSIVSTVTLLNLINREIHWGWAGAGVLAAVIAIPMNRFAKNKIKSAVDIYNGELANLSYDEDVILIDLKVSKTGGSLCFTF